MGKFKRGKRKVAKGTKTPAGTPRVDSRPTSYVMDFKNEAFEAYYREQLKLSEDDFQRFLDIAKTHLPLTFRLTGSKVDVANISRCLDGVLNATYDEDQSIESTPAEIVKRIPWYNPAGEDRDSPQSARPSTSLAFQCSISKQQLKASAMGRKFKEFLINQTDQGNISRQEAVSMIPPLLSDIQKNHKVLDMCAAPGSKTAQLIEMIHSKNSDDALIVANELDFQRGYMLVHQIKRLCSPFLVVTNHNGISFPTLFHKGEPLLFDRVICDVPCSGDGTIRKAPNMWARWTYALGNNLHSTQVGLLHRAYTLSKPDALVVYSTCSLNPIENEAVVAELLRRYPDTLEVVPRTDPLVADRLKGLIMRDGLDAWDVYLKAYTTQPQASPCPDVEDNNSKDAQDHEGGAEVKSAKRAKMEVEDAEPQASAGQTDCFHRKRAPQRGPKPASTWKKYVLLEDAKMDIKAGLTDPKHYHKSMFKPKDSEQSIKDQLKHCIRVYPHDQNTGGFFITLLRKKIPTAATAPMAVTSQQQKLDGSTNELDDYADDLSSTASITEFEQPPQKKNRHEAPFCFRVAESELVKGALKFFSFDENHSEVYKLENLFTRSATEYRTIYMASSTVRKLILSNAPPLKLIYAGIPVYERTRHRDQSICPYRFTQDSLNFLPKSLTRTVHMGSEHRSDFINFLVHETVTLGDVASDGLRASISTLKVGCFVVELNLPEDHLCKRISVWKGAHSVCLLIPPESCLVLLTILCGFNEAQLILQTRMEEMRLKTEKSMENQKKVEASRAAGEELPEGADALEGKDDDLPSEITHE